MKAEIKSKEFCIWFVPANTGKVKKIRLGAGHILMGGLVLSIIGGGIGFVLGDYGRLQLVRAKEYLSVQLMASEKQTVSSENSELKGKLAELETANSRALAYERNLRARMGELTSAIESAASLGLLSSEDFKKKPSKAKGAVAQGVGGLELDCLPSSGSECDMSNMDDLDNNSSRITVGSEPEDLLEAIDRYTDLFKTLPITSPGNGHINSGYGFRVSPFTKKVKKHEGVDFSLPLGSRIVASGDGIVRRVQRTSTYGLMIDIAHSGTVSTRYAHLSKALVKVGQKVCRGQALGLVGSTGRSTGPHLHYEVRVNGRTIDPMKAMKLVPSFKGVLG